MEATLLMTATLVLGLSAGVLAQAQPDPHHPDGAPSQTQSAPALAPSQGQATPAPASPPEATPPVSGQMPMGQMMQGMPEQCRSMMQSIPQGCMPMMQQMMQGRMGTAPGGAAMTNMAAQPSASSASSKAYLDAADRMHAPMMQGLQAADPDVAFVRGMIAHHQGAIDMAKIRVQFGKDEQTKKWAEVIIREQQREIDEMQEWLKKNVR